MATTTPNLGLTKPATSDNVDITVINGNMDILDTAVAGISSDTTINITFNSGYTPAYGYARKSVNVVGINIYWSSLAKTTSWVIIGSIPAAYAPLNDTYFIDPVGVGNQVMFYISSTGNIGVKAASAFSSASACAITYVI